MDGRNSETYPLPDGPRIAVMPLVGKSMCIFVNISFLVVVLTDDTTQKPSSLMEAMVLGA